MKLVFKDAPLPSELLDHAADLIDEWGHARFTYCADSGAMCEEGAVRAASGWDHHIQRENVFTKNKYWALVDGTPWSSQDAAVRYLLSVGGGPNHSDRGPTDKGHAVAKLREAANKAR